MDDFKVCTRVSLHSGICCRSHAGISVRASNGVVHTFLLNNGDPNIAVQISGSGDPEDFVAVFHVFVGPLLLALEARDFEVFRFHGEEWPAFLEAEEEPLRFGEEVFRATSRSSTRRHVYEHVSGLWLTNAHLLSAQVQAGAPFFRTMQRLTPDAALYRADCERIPHPGLVAAGDEVEAMEACIRHERFLVEPRLM